MQGWETHILEVAKHFKGKPSHVRGNEARWGTHGSFSVDIAKGVFTDHESGESGGVADLIRSCLPDGNKPGAVATFIEEFLDEPKSEMADEVSAFAAPQYVEAEYHYLNAAGEPYLRVERHAPQKTFRQYLPDGRPPTSDPDFKPVPYRLEKILSRTKAPVFIVEGEKDVHNLEAFGLLATCNHGGSGKWTDIHAAYLANRKVVIIPDNDDPGDKHAKQVIKTLKGIAAEIRRVDLPGLLPKGDVSDWIEGGGNKEQLVALVKSAPPITQDDLDLHYRVITLGDLMEREPVPWLIPNYIPEQSLVAIYGDPGSYKTFLTLDMMLCVSHGYDFHKMSVDQGLVVYVAGEGVGGLRKRVGAWHEANEPNVANAQFLLIEEPVPLREEGAVDHLIADIEALRNGRDVKCIVFDTLARCMSGDENSSTDMGDAIRAMDIIKGHFGAAIIAVHHQGKDSGRGLRGSSALLGALDVALQCKKHDQHLEVVTQKQKDHEPAEPQYFEAQLCSYQQHALDDPDSSLVLVMADEKPNLATNLSQPQAKCLKALQNVLVEYGERDNPAVAKFNVSWPTVDQNLWEAESLSMSLADGEAESQKKAWKRAVKGLEKKGLVAARNGRVWLVKHAAD